MIDYPLDAIVHQTLERQIVSHDKNFEHIIFGQIARSKVCVIDYFSHHAITDSADCDICRGSAEHGIER